MALVKYKKLEVDFKLIAEFPYEYKKNLRLIACNSSDTHDYLFVEIETANGRIPLFYNFPVLAFDTYFIPYLIDLDKADKIWAKSMLGKIDFSIHENT